MKTTAWVVVAFGILSLSLAAQELKPVPKDSVRVYIPGCTKGYVFTASRRTQDEPGSAAVPEGTHLRMNGPKKIMSDIKAHEGSLIEITGLMKKGQNGPGGITIGGLRISPGATPGAGGGGGGMATSPDAGQILIDVEGWRQVTGSCPSR